MAVEPPQLRESPSGVALGVATLAGFANLLWVNALAAAGGTGSVVAPFQTPAQAVAAVPSGASATIVLAPSDYSATPAISIVDRDITFECFGNVESGARSPIARAKLPAITFGVSTGTLQFCARNCDMLAGVTCLDAVNANLYGCSAVWTDAGAVSDVRAFGFPELFAGLPQQSFNGSCGNCFLWGCSTTSLACTNFSGVLGRVMAGGTGIVGTNTVGARQYEFDAGGVVFQAPGGVFLDDWSLFQALENGANLGVAPALSTQELNSYPYVWCSGGWDNNQFLNPSGIKGFAASATAVLEWMSAPRKLFVTRIAAQLSAVIANDVTFTLHQAATLGALAATTVAITVTAGQLRATPVDFPTPLVVPQGNYMAVQVTKAGGAIAANGCEVQVFYL